MNKITKRLLLCNLAVFVFVLSVFSVTVYLFWQQQTYREARMQLSRLTDSVIASIDFDTAGRKDAGQPDSIASVLPDEAAKSLLNLRLQWFSPDGKLVREKGQLQISVPFKPDGQYQVQSAPHALLLTRPAFYQGHLLGYARVAQPLFEADQSMMMLISGLAIGMVVALSTAAAGMLWLIKQSLKPIKDNISRLKQFAADASHELRSPIMAIKTNASVALKYADGMRDRDSEKFIAILDATEQMEKLTADLLALSVAERKQLMTELKSVNLSALINEVLLDLKSLAESKQQNLFARIQSEIPVFGSPDDLKRLFHNVIENAIIYTPEFGEITVSCFMSHSRVVLSVNDTGIGIATNDLNNVFDRFWRADKARTHRYAGNGLGLAIAKAIVDKHMGSISVASQPGQGSQFTICLPMEASMLATKP